MPQRGRVTYSRLTANSIDLLSPQLSIDPLIEVNRQTGVDLHTTIARSNGIQDVMLEIVKAI